MDLEANVIVVRDRGAPSLSRLSRAARIDRFTRTANPRSIALRLITLTCPVALSVVTL